MSKSRSNRIHIWSSTHSPGRILCGLRLTWHDLYGWITTRGTNNSVVTIERSAAKRLISEAGVCKTCLRLSRKEN